MQLATKTIFSHLEPPKLWGESTNNFIAFQRLRGLYEKYVYEKKESQTHISSICWARCLWTTGELQILIDTGWIYAPSIEAVTKQQIKECVLKRCQKDEKGGNCTWLGCRFKVGMEMNTLGAQGKAWSLHRHYLVPLQNTRRNEVLENKMHISKKRILHKSKPLLRIARVKSIILLQKNDQCNTKHFIKFVGELGPGKKQMQQERARPFFKLSHDTWWDEDTPKHGSQLSEKRKSMSRNLLKKRVHMKNGPSQLKVQCRNKWRNMNAYVLPFPNKTCWQNGGKLQIQQRPNSLDSRKVKLPEKSRKAKIKYLHNCSKR